MATKATELQPQAVRDVVVASGVIASLLLGVAKWINADVRTPQYFLQLACVLSGGLLLGVGVGALIPVLLHVWRWHKTTSLADPNQTE
jgi:hypothetical protein